MSYTFVEYRNIGKSTSLDDYASGAGKIVIGSAETIIGYAFRESSITSVDMPEVWAIGNYAFNYSQRLESVGFSKIQSIGEFAFSSCAKLRLTEFPNTLKSIGKSAFSGCSKISPTKLPPNFTTLSASAFSSCSSITEMEIPASVTYIGDNAFYNCSGLTTVTFKGTIASLGTIFSGCKNLTTINVPWAKGEVAGEDTCWGAPNATINYTNYGGSSDGELITFTYDYYGETHTFECPKDYTWHDFINSDYNTGGMFMFDEGGEHPWCVMDMDCNSVDGYEFTFVADWANGAGTSGMVGFMIWDNNELGYGNHCLKCPIGYTWRDFVGSKYDTTNGLLTINGNGNVFADGMDMCGTNGDPLTATEIIETFAYGAY